LWSLVDLDAEACVNVFAFVGKLTVTIECINEILNVLFVFAADENIINAGDEHSCAIGEETWIMGAWMVAAFFESGAEALEPRATALFETMDVFDEQKNKVFGIGVW